MGGELERTVFRKVTFRLMPFLCLLYIVNILDRVNVSFARLKMEDLPENPQRVPGLSGEVYALGAGIFYLSYCALEVPSNLILSRTGTRRWMARIMVSWGLVSAAMMFVAGPWSFVLLRLLLGAAEAGFFPGILLYLTYWYPARQRARAVALFMVASPLVGIVGGPLSGWLLDRMDQMGGLSGWQWLFLLEALPAVVLGVVTFYYLTDRPEQARWLTENERSWLTERLKQEEKQREAHHGARLWRAVKDFKVWHLVLLYVTICVGISGLAYHSPKLLSNRFPGSSASVVGLLAAVPHLGAMVSMVGVGIHSDRSGERRWHIALSGFVAAVGWGMYTGFTAPLPSFLGLVLAQMGMVGMQAPFWALPPSFLSGRAAAGGIALINAFGNLGGFLGTYILGGRLPPPGGLVVMALVPLCSAALALCVRPAFRDRPAAAD
jgi:ACS family tartrate transporter-like MFS transporter